MLDKCKKNTSDANNMYISVQPLIKWHHFLIAVKQKCMFQKKKKKTTDRAKLDRCSEIVALPSGDLSP